MVGVAVEGLAHLARWLDLVAARPAVQKGLLMPPSPHELEVGEQESQEQFAHAVRGMLETGQSRYLN